MKQYSQQQIKFINDSFQQGQRAMQMSMFNRAEKYFSDIVKVAPEIIEAQNALALAYAATKQHAKAATQFKIILKSKPSEAHTHHNLANTLYELGRFDEAIQHYQSAIKINPKLVDSHIHCGIAYRALKNHDAAIKYLHQALNIDKANARAFHILGVVYAEIEDYARALECLQNASGLAPQNLEFNISYAELLAKVGLNTNAAHKFHEICLNNPNQLKPFLLYGNHLLRLRYYNEALECYERALQLGANDLDTLDNLGRIYLGLGDVETALTKFNQALTIEPKRLSSLTGVEKAYQDAGKVENAKNACDKIIALYPEKPLGHILKTAVTKSTPSDGLADNLLKYISNDNLDQDSEIVLNFALGKIYDDQKDYQRAFKFYSKGNALRNERLDYDQVASKDFFTHLIETFDREFFNNYQYSGSDSTVPILIVGMPRSATTLTEQIISSHSQVMGAGEVEFWSDTVRSMSYLINTSSKFPDCVAKINQDHAKDITGLYLNTLHKITGLDSEPVHITDKMPHNFLYIGLIATLFPNAKIIHTKRDPIDTCLSIFFQNFNDDHPYTFDLNNLGFYYRQYERLMQHWHKVLPGRIMDINYADTIDDPEYWTRKLISHIGLNWDDACLAPYKLERSVKTPSHWQVRQPIYKTSVQRWKNYEEYIQPLIHALNSDA